MVLLLSIAIASCALSLLAAFGAEKLTSVIPLVGSFIVLRLSHNSGIAFSIALPGSSQNILIIAALIIVIVMALRGTNNRVSTIAFGLILGGAFANLFDRIPDGLVTDFIAVGSFPIFNIADAFITIGAAVLLLESVLRRKKGKEKSIHSSR